MLTIGLDSGMIPNQCELSTFCVLRLSSYIARRNSQPPVQGPNSSFVRSIDRIVTLSARKTVNYSSVRSNKHATSLSAKSSSCNTFDAFFQYRRRWYKEQTHFSPPLIISLAVGSVNSPPGAVSIWVVVVSAVVTSTWHGHRSSFDSVRRMVDFDGALEGDQRVKLQQLKPVWRSFARGLQSVSRVLTVVICHACQTVPPNVHATQTDVKNVAAASSSSSNELRHYNFRRRGFVNCVCRYRRKWSQHRNGPNCSAPVKAVDGTSQDELTSFGVSIQYPLSWAVLCLRRGLTRID